MGAFVPAPSKPGLGVIRCQEIGAPFISQRKYTGRIEPANVPELLLWPCVKAFARQQFKANRAIQDGKQRLVFFFKDNCIIPEFKFLIV